MFERSCYQRVISECEVLKEGWCDRCTETQQYNSEEWGPRVVGPACLCDDNYSLDPKSNWKLLKGMNLGGKSPYLQHEKICLTTVRLEGLSGRWIHFRELAAKRSPSLHFRRLVDGNLYAPDSSRCVCSLNPMQKPVHCLDMQPKNCFFSMSNGRNTLCSVLKRQ